MIWLNDGVLWNKYGKETKWYLVQGSAAGRWLNSISMTSWFMVYQTNLMGVISQQTNQTGNTL